MNETKTLKEWMERLSYTWIAGQEMIYKGELTAYEAVHELETLEQRGAVKRGN